MTTLKGGIDKLVENYTVLDGGINEYTGAVNQISQGYNQICDGALDLVKGTSTLYDLLFCLPCLIKYIFMLSLLVKRYLYSIIINCLRQIIARNKLINPITLTGFIITHFHNSILV